MQQEADLIGQLASTVGEAKRELLLSLCDFRSGTADDFWRKRLACPGNGYLPYFCFSRSDAAADHAAAYLERAVERLLHESMPYSGGLTEALWYALNLSAFKESDRMVEILRKIGENADAFADVTLDFQVLLSSDTLPPFLRRQAELAQAHNFETGFLRLLNDLLVCTYVRSEGDFLPSLLHLAEEFPQAFGYAGFFALFVTDPKAAFRCYANPVRIAQVLGTFAGLEYSETSGICLQYSPLWFYGAKNRIWQRKLQIPVPDADWMEWLCRSYCFSTEAQRKILSGLLFQFTWMQPQQAQLRDYFFHAALEDTSECNLVGLMRCGGMEMTEALIHDICEKISQGRNHYHALFAVFELLDLKKAEKLRLLEQARNYIESTDHRESWYAQRNHFLHAVKLYRDGNHSTLMI